MKLIWTTCIRPGGRQLSTVQAPDPDVPLSAPKLTLSVGVTESRKGAGSGPAALVLFCMKADIVQASGSISALTC